MRQAKSIVFIILILTVILGSMGFATENEPQPIRLTVKGRLINLKTNAPLKRLPITLFVIGENSVVLDFIIPNIRPYPGKTNGKGEFLIDIDLYADNLEFHLTHPFAYGSAVFSTLDVLVPGLDTTQTSGTLDLGDVYFVAYDNELNSVDLVKEAPKRSAAFEQFTLNEVDSIFKLPNNPFNMQMNPIDTTVVPRKGSENYPESRTMPAGSFKSLSFTRKID